MTDVVFIPELKKKGPKTEGLLLCTHCYAS